MAISPWRSTPLLAALCLAGCVTQNTTTATYTSTGTGATQSRDGLVMSLEIVSDPRKLKELFDVDHLDDGVIAIHADVRNQSPAKSFIVQPASFNAVSGLASDTHGTANKGDTLGVVGMAVLSLPLLGIAGAMQGNDTVVKNNMLRREFKSVTLQPGNTTSGFLFFRSPDGKAPPKLHVDVNASEAGTGRSVQYTYELSN